MFIEMSMVIFREASVSVRRVFVKYLCLDHFFYIDCARVAYHYLINILTLIMKRKHLAQN